MYDTQERGLCPVLLTTSSRDFETEGRKFRMNAVVPSYYSKTRFSAQYSSS